MSAVDPPPEPAATRLPGPPLPPSQRPLPEPVRTVPQGVPPPGVRPTAAERETAAVRLRQAFVDDRLTLDEYSERLSLVYGARTDTELAAVVADLPPLAEPEPEPARAPQAPAPVSHQRPPQGAPSPWRRFVPWAVAAVVVAVLGAGMGGVPDRVAIMGGTEVSAEQILQGSDAGSLDVAAVMGGADIDLREMQPGQEITIDGVAVMGGVNIAVDPGTRVNHGGIAIMGGSSCEPEVCSADVEPDAPIVNVRVDALMGGVSIEPGEPGGT